jgi:hypothetical protein
MYGTIGRFRIKAGMEGRFRQLIAEQAPAFEAGRVPGFIASYSYRTDADPNDYCSKVNPNGMMAKSSAAMR